MRAAAVLVVLALAAPSVAADAGLTDEDRADLAWLDGLADVAIAGKPFVEVRQGTWHATRGFLVADDNAHVRLVSAGLGQWRLERSTPGTPDDQRLVVEPLDLRELARDWLAGGPSPAQTSVDLPLPHWPHPDEPSVRTRTVVCAWALFHAGTGQDVTLVHDLLAHARSSRADAWGQLDASKPFRARLADDLAAAELFRARQALAGSWTGGAVHASDRAGQLEAMRAVMRRFPGSSSEAEAKGWADLLERMARDDAEHAKTAKALVSMTPEERRRELVFRLREQEANGPGVNGGPGMLVDGPYTELVKDGLASVPALLDALADDSLTRVGGSGRAGFSPFVLRVQAIALQAIEAIAGRTFTTADERPVEGVAWPIAVRPAIEAWYAEVKDGDEIGSLVRAVEKGDWYSAQAARTLLAKDAARAPAALVRSLDAAGQHALTRSDLLRLLAQHPGDAGIDVLRKEAASARWTAFEATTLLAEIGDPSATQLLLARWRERRDGGGPPTAPPEQGTFRMRTDELSTLATALVATKDAAVVRALADDLPKRAALAREAAVLALAAARAAATGDLATAIDAALADALDDRTETHEWIDESQPAAGFALRTCDVAAAAMAASRGLVPPTASDSYATRDSKVAAVAAACGRRLVAPSVQTAPDTVRGAFDVRAVRFVPGDAAAGPKVRSMVAALVGKPFAASAFADVARAILASGKGASLDVDRVDAASGVVVTWTLLDGRGDGWEHSARAIRGGRWLPDGSGSWSLHAPDERRELVRLAESALAAAPDERAWLHFVAVRRDSHD